VADEPKDENSQPAPASPDPRARGGAPGDGRYFDRTVANRLFPGPSKLRSKQAMDRIDGLLQPLDDGTRPNPLRNRRPQPPATAAADAEQLRDTLEQQNDLLRAILASTVDTQADARSTAQNSRTFAWAGTAIALLTLIATVIAIVAAVRTN
jgi:hypothetical protein